MRTKTAIASLMLAGLAAASTSALAYGPGPYGGGRHMMGPRGGTPPTAAEQSARVQARLDTLKSALKLQPEQAGAWNAYEARVKSEAQVRAEMRRGMLEHRGDAQAMADHRVTMMKHNAQAAEEINGLRKALLATLSAEQKATFDQHAFAPRFAGGPGLDRGQGFGPGYGPGGGRGPGYGRGCIGGAA